MLLEPILISIDLLTTLELLLHSFIYELFYTHIPFSIDGRVGDR